MRTHQFSGDASMMSFPKTVSRSSNIHPERWWIVKKTFDCVAMKHKIQERQMLRLKGLSPEEESQLIQTAISKNPVLLAFSLASKAQVKVPVGE
jgi:hypothetical protein